MRRTCVVALALVALIVSPTGAQEKAPVPAPAAPSVGGPKQIPLKVQLTLTRLLGEKKVSSVPYMLGVLTNADKTSLRMGVQVPVLQTVFGPKTEGASVSIPQGSYSYRQVGTNIDCAAQDAGNGLFNLVITVEDSAVQLDPAGGSADDKKERHLARDVPAFRTFRASFATILRDGQTMQYASATDPVTGEVMRIDVALSLAK